MWDHRIYYVLSEVYWRTGYALYGDHWTGTETAYRPDCDLDELRQRHKEAAAAFERHQDHARFLSRNIPDQLTDTEYRAHRAEIGAAEDAAAAARLERDQLSDALRVREQNQRYYDRRVSVERRLVRAFTKGELDLIQGTGTIVEWEKWAKHAAFRVSFGKSLIYAPSHLCNNRRDTGFVARESFDNWLSNVFENEVKVAKREGADRFVKMQEWFINWIAENPEEPGKELSRQQFNKAFKPKGKTTFDNLWAALAPPSWKGKGRRGS